MEQKITGTYIYDEGTRDQVRLDILNEVYNPTSKQAILDNGLKKAKMILEIACGQGQLTCWMAESVKETNGQVIGIDISAEQLKIAEELAQKKNLNNIHFIKMSVEEVGALKNQLSGKPDFIYCRWLLMHLNSGKVSSIISSIRDIADGNAVIMHEECTLRESEIAPVSLSYAKYLKLFDKLAKTMNVNYDMGSDLKKLMNEAGYKNVKDSSVMPLFSKKQLRFFALDVDSARSPFLQTSTCSSQEVDNLIYDLHEDINVGASMTMTNHIVSGIK